MKPVVLITGASSGIGQATALHFAARGWQVAAAMRHPGAPFHPGIWPVRLDVEDQTSIQACIADVLGRYGQIDALVNNAGIGGFGAFEGSSDDQRRRLFEVNVLGLMSLVEAVLPHFRQRRTGTLANVSSIGGLMTYPLFSVYHGTKWAVEGFSESLYYELKPLGIRVRLIEPGATRTDFGGRSLVRFHKPGLPYEDYVRRLQRKADHTLAEGLHPDEVAARIFEAVTDKGTTLRYPVGNRRSMSLLYLRRWFPTRLFMAMIERSMR